MTHNPKPTMIDHAARARELLVEANSVGGAANARQVAEAHVHATLALVEEQRTANLIAAYTSAAFHGSARADLGASLRARLFLNPNTTQEQS